MDTTSSNISEFNIGKGQSFQKIGVRIIVIGCGTFLLGVAVALVTIYLYKDKIFANRMATVNRFSLGRLPDCIPREIKNTDDKNLIVYILKYDEIMSERMETLLTQLSNEKYKTLVQSEIKRKQKEVVLMKSTYKTEYGEEYDAEKATTSLMSSIRLSDDVSDQKDYSEKDRMSLFRGELEYIDREYYVFALLSKNKVIVENATNFKSFKKDIISKILDIKP